MLTDTRIKTAKPQAKLYKLTDERGLHLSVYPNASKLWQMRYRTEGKERTASLGKYPEVSLAAAREKRDQMRKLIAKGIDPVQSQKADKEAKKLAQTNSFEAVARTWFEGWSAARSPRHAEYVIRRLEADVFPVIGSRPVSEIQAPELVKMMKAIQLRGALDIAKRCYQMTGQVFRYAVAHGIAERNPASDIKPSDILPSRRQTNYARVDAKELWDETISGPVLGDVSDLELLHYRALLEDWDADRVRDEITPYLDLEMHYEDWIRVGQALYHQFDGSEEGFALWDEMFQDSSKYGGESYGHDRWRSFKTHRAYGRGPVTLASVIKMVKEKRDKVRRSDRDKELMETLSEIEATQDARELQDQIAAKVANNSLFSDVEREQIAGAIQAKGKTLGVKLQIGRVRGWVHDRSGGGDRKLPELMKDWVYVTSGDKFFNKSTKQEVTAKGFAAIYNREMPLNQHGRRDKADVCALEQWGMEVVTNKAYMPDAGQTFEMFGLKYVNLYRPEAVPPVPESLSPEEMDAIEIVKQHLEIYFPDERERGLVLSFCAHNVQHPGKKIRWALYIHGVPGDGKTFFGELIAKAMGEQNVGNLTGSTLESPFTGWSIGNGVVVIEEMKQHGSNRFVVMNRIKPFITNTSIEVHEKHKASYTALNRTNYIILSNYLDGAPVDAADRRYMFLSSRLTVQEVENRSKEGYFDRLFGAINKHPGAIRKWLLSVQLHPEFDANGRAPDTAIKNIVVEISKSDLEAAAEDLIESGAKGVCANVISSAHLTTALSSSGITLATTQVGRLLTRLGFEFAHRMKWRGKTCRLYLRRGMNMSLEEMIQALDASGDCDFLE